MNRGGESEDFHAEGQDALVLIAKTLSTGSPSPPLCSCSGALWGEGNKIDGTDWSQWFKVRYGLSFGMLAGPMHLSLS